MDINHVREIGKEGVGLRPIKNIFVDKEENKEKNERYLDVVSGMKKIELDKKMKTERYKWYNKYRKNFLKDMLDIHKRTKVVTTKEKIWFCDSDTEKTSEEENEEELSDKKENEEEGNEEEDYDTSDYSDFINEAYHEFRREKK